MTKGWAISGCPNRHASEVILRGKETPRGGIMQRTGFREQFAAITDAWALAQGIVDTVREPVIVLD
jgi:hypothetical protein